VSISRATEQSILTNDQFQIVSKTHHPAIYELDPGELRELRRQLREERGKAQTHARQLQREGRGKSEPRGKAFPGPGEHPLRRKQAIANALKRVNREIERLSKIEARTAHVEAARRALAMHRSAQFREIPASKTASEGMQPQPSMRRRKIVSGSRIGSVSQATRIAQAIKDNRGS
jgi:hypothetical protein